MEKSVDTVSADLREIAPTIFLGVPRIWEKLQQTILIKLRESYRVNQRIVERAVAFATRVARKEVTPGQRPGALEGAALWALRLTVFRNLRRFTGLHRCRACFCGAASVSPEVLLFFRAIGLPIYQVYGMTETAAVAFQQMPGHETFGCVGVPVPGLEYRLAEDGELQMRGPTVFPGYLDAPEATQAAFADGWLLSGDIARIVNGEIQIVDRKKDLIVTSGGKNIAPSEVEHALKESAYVREAMALKEARESQEAWNQAASASGDLLRGMIDGTIEWKDALVEAGKIALKLLNDLAKAQGSKGIFGGGFFQNLLGGLLGISFHGGGTVGAGGARTAIPLDAPFAGVFHGGGNFGGRRAKHDEVMALVQKHENIFTNGQTDKIIGALSASASRMKERDYVQEILVRGVFVDDGGVVHGIADSSSAKMGAQVARAVPSMAIGAMDDSRTRRRRTISPGGVI